MTMNRALFLWLRPRPWLWLAPFFFLACQPGCAPGGTTPAGALPVGGPVTLTEVELPQPATMTPVGFCLVFEDLDADGLPDLFFLPASDGNTVIDHGTILRNRGGGKFEQADVPLSPHTIRVSNGCTAGDYDDDGLPDLLITSFEDLVLLHNKGGLAFEDRTRAAGIGLDKHINARDAAFIDYDLDGRLDLYIATQSMASTAFLIFDCAATSDDFQCRYRPTNAPLGSAAILYKNVDGKTFQSASGSAGAVNNTGSAFDGGMPNVVAVTDWNLDGRPDLLVANDYGINRLYLNDHGNGFTSAAAAAGLELYNHGMGLAQGDFDGDGRLDLYVADLGPNQLWFGREGGTVENRAISWGVAEPTRFDSNWAPLAVDLNQDGWLDVLAASSGVVSNNTDLDLVAHDMVTVTTDTPQVDTLFVNQGSAGRFSAQTVPHPKYFAPSPNTAALAAADFDGDGDLDIAEVYGRSPVLHLRLLRNDTQSPGNYLGIQLINAHGNRDAVGALVRVQAGGHEQLRIQHGKSGSLGKSTDTLHFGLGKATSVDSVHVVWPGGTMLDLPGPIAAGQVLVVKRM